MNRKSKPLGDLFKTAAGGTPSTLNRAYYDGGTVPWLLSGAVRVGVIREVTTFITELGLANSNAKIFPRESVLVALYGATAGQVGILDIEASTNQAVLGIYPNGSFLPKFIFYLLLSSYDVLIAQAIGNAQPNISGQKVKAVSVPMLPLPEQQRIVGILDEAFAGLATAKANAEKNLRNARELFESELQSVFTRCWGEKPLDSVATILNGYAFKSTDFSASAGSKCIKITNVGVREFVSSSEGGFLPKGFEKEYKTVAVNGGSVVIALTRTIIAGGLKVAIVPDEFDGALLNQRFASIIANEQQLSQSFLFAYLSSGIVVDYVTNRVNTLMQPNLSIADLRAMPIPIPPRAEQESVTALLNQLREETQRLESLYQQKLAALDALKKSLLHQAFSGQL